MKIKTLKFLIPIWLVFSLNYASAVDKVINVNPNVGFEYCAKNSTYTSMDKSYSLVIPNIGEKLFIEDKIISEGITYHSTFAELNTGFIYIVSTKIQDTLPKGPKILDRVRKRYEVYSEKLPADFVDRFEKGKFGKYYEFELKHATSMSNSEQPYPLALGYKKSKDKNELGQFAFHRFLVANGYLIEVAVLVHNRGKLKGKGNEALINEAHDWMKIIENGLMPGTPNICE